MGRTAPGLSLALVAGAVRELVYNDEVAHVYLGPTLTDRLRTRFEAVA